MVVVVFPTPPLWFKTAIREQLASLFRIGRQQVGEHIRCDDRIAEQVEQYDLEGGEDDERKGQPDHDAGAFQHGAPHQVETHRDKERCFGRPDGVRLRI